MRVLPLASLALAATLAHARANFRITHDPLEVPGAVVRFGDVRPLGELMLRRATPLGEGVESHGAASEIGRPPIIGWRFAGLDRLDNVFAPALMGPPVAFAYYTPVAATGVWIQGVTSYQGAPAATLVHVYALDRWERCLFEESVALPVSTDGQSTEVYIGVVCDEAVIARIDFVLNGGATFRNLRPGGPAIGVCGGDANGDGVVDFLDLNLVLTEFGQTGADLRGDLDGDFDCDFQDLSVTLSAYGSAC